MSDIIRIGVIGAGRIGKLHARTLSALVPGVKVTAISDLVPEAAGAVAAECGIGRVAADHRDILADRDIDAVAICSSTDTHAGLIEEAAAAGKHIFCEKPIALDLERIDRALKAVADRRVLLMVGFNRRYDAGNARLREAVASGRIGAPELCLISSRDPAPPPLGYLKVSGGLFLDMMIHDFDLARFLLGDEPEEVFAFAGCLVDPEIGKIGDVDTAMAAIRFKKGAICHIDNSRRAVYGYDQRAEVFGSLGMAQTDHQYNDNTVLALASGFSRPPIKNFFLERYLPAYQEEGRVFAQCVREGREPPAAGRDGRIAVAMGYAALKSAKEGRPVKMSEFPGC
ncbi:MAG: inositol 2-dehydrogenase [Planctomycetota bacterium]|jgi:myo-inositol 2-dehydrogenase/D-chiro-inositol 1-dehydrogenase|nr:inositol 2-dehydrogenase [Planctomycetota bacterium]